MKCHYFIEATHSGTYDLDKKIPSLKKLFPTSKLEKKGIGFSDREFIIIKDIADVKLVSYDGTPCDIDLSLDYYLTAVLGYSFIDIQFEITEKMTKEITISKMIFNSKMIFEGEEQSVSNLISTVLWKCFQHEEMEKVLEDEKYRKDLNNVDLESMREDIFDEFGVELFYNADHLPGGFSAGVCDIFIEDYDNKLSMDDEWENISTNENELYMLPHRDIYVLKKEAIFKDAMVFMSENMLKNRIFNSYGSMCSGWMARIGKKVDPIRKNINSKHQNKFYWQELKRKIEVIDLNFLEFHTSAIRNLDDFDGMPDTLDLSFTKEYKNEYLKEVRYKKQSIHEYLDEIKYAIRNLATPGHTNDEHLLQEQTEITNERILLLSFLAMSIPMLGAIFSPDFTISTKIVSATVLLSLPILYLFTMKIRKSLAYKRNIRMELKRQYNDLSKSLIKEKQVTAQLQSYDVLPEDLRETLITFHEKSIVGTEKRLSKLDKYK